MNYKKNHNLFQSLINPVIKFSGRSTEDCHYYHVLPVGFKCSCRPGYDLSPEGKCIEGKSFSYGYSHCSYLVLYI